MATILSAPDRTPKMAMVTISTSLCLGSGLNLGSSNDAMNELFHPFLKGVMGWEHQSQGTSGVRACEQTNLISIQFPGFWRDCLV